MNLRTVKCILAALTLMLFTQGTGSAQVYVNSDSELVNEIYTFTLLSLNLGIPDSEVFIYDGSSYLVDVNSDGTFELTVNGTSVYLGSDPGEFNTYLFGYLVIAGPGGLLVVPPEIDIDTIIQAQTSQVIMEVPGGPMDEVFSQIVFGRSVGGRLAVDVDDGGGGPVISEGSTVLRYTRFQSGGVEGNVFGLTLGWERESDRWRYGLVVPYDHIDYDGTTRDGDSFTLSPFLQYVAMRDPVKFSAGPYIVLNHTFINNNKNFQMHGAGLSASVEKYFDQIFLRFGTSVEYVDTNVKLPDNSTIRWRNGITLGFPVTEKITSRLYFMNTIADEGLLGGDNNYSSLGAEVAASVSEAFSMTMGVQTSIGHQDTTVYSGYIGGQMMLR